MGPAGTRRGRRGGGGVRRRGRRLRAGSLRAGDRRGRFSAHGTPGGSFAVPDAADADRRGITVVGIGDVRFPPERARRYAERALAEAAAGRVRPLVGQTFPLERVAEAHAAIEGRAVIGKTLLTVG
ncbi:zinc-binding dehydrogenase [Micromonospora zhanjiangensis]